MKNNSKRICALLLAIVMCIGCVVPVFAAPDAAGREPHADGVTCPGVGAEHTMANAPYVFVKIVPAKCGEWGYTVYECETCKAPILTDWTQLEGEEDHAYGDWTLETNPTCDTYGKATKTCSRPGCGHVVTVEPADETAYLAAVAQYGDAIKIVNKREHVMDNDKNTSLECKDGIPAWKEWCTYDDCDHEIEHAATPGQDCVRYVDRIVTAPTCYANGVAVVKCENCSYESLEVVVNATNSGLGHVWAKLGDFTTAPTCGKAGSGNAKCSVCGLISPVVEGKVTVQYYVGTELKTEQIDVAGFEATGVHSFTVDQTGSAATCEGTGTEAHKKCENCDAVSFDGTTEVPATALVIPALGHIWGDVAAEPHTCEEDGVKAHFKCSVCGKLTFDKNADPIVYITEDDTVVPAMCDYDLTTPVATRAPSCTLYGFWFYGCGVCGTPAESNGSDAGETPVPTEAVKTAYGDEVTAEWVSNGVLRISKLPHRLQDPKPVVQAGSCIDDYIVAEDCLDCDYYKEVPTTAPGHTWTTVTYAQNCKFDGYKFDYCSVCGFVAGANTADGIAIDECVEVRKGTATEAEATAANPATNGKYDVVPADPNNHKWDEVKTNVTTPATCTTMGKAVKFCVLCSDYYNVDLPALGHNNEAYVSETDPKCGVDGYYVYECSRCGEDSTQVHIKAHEMASTHPDYATKYYATKHVALKHTFVTKADVYTADLPTNYIFVHDETDPRYVAPVATGADCTTPGYDTYKCVNPGCTETHTFSKKADGTHIYPALDHKEAGVDKYVHVTILPNCKPADIYKIDESGKLVPGTDGVIDLVGIDGVEYDECSLCHDKKNEVVIVFNWNVAAHHRDPADPSKVAGVYADTKWHNGVEYADAAAADAAADAELAGSTANGVMRVGRCDVSEITEYYCDVCGYTFHVVDDSMVGDHVAKAGTTVALDPAECLTAGKYEHYECEICNEKVYVNADGEHVVYEDDTVLVIPALGHDFSAGITAEDPADCTTAGVKAYYECARCHNKYLTNETNNTANKIDAELVIDALGHKWGEKGGAVAPSCGVAGVLAHHECERCDAVSLDGENACAESAIVDPALTHSYVHSTAVTVTCVTPGYQYHYCKNCGDEYVDGYVYPLGHVFEDKAIVEAKCGTDGKAAHKFCDVCDKQFAADETNLTSTNYKSDDDLKINKTGIHKNAAGDTVVDICTSTVEDRFCTGCNQTIGKSHPTDKYKTNHVDATCTEYGYDAWTCSECNGFGKTADSAIEEPTGHNFEWIVTTPAGMYNAGVETLMCVNANCDAHTTVGSIVYGKTFEATDAIKDGDTALDENGQRVALVAPESSTRAIPATGGIEFSYEIDNAIVSGAEYVNGGKIKLTIKYKAAGIDLSNVALRLDYNALGLTFVSGDFKCDAKDGDKAVFNIENASIGGKTAGVVIVKASTTGFGEAPANKKLEGEGIFAEIYFNINKNVDAGATIGFSVAETGNLASGVYKIVDGEAVAVAANFGSVDSIVTKALGDIDIDDAFTSADEVEFLNIAFGNRYVAEADINQDGIIGSDDYALINDLLLGNITYEEMCAAAQAKPAA